MPPDDKLDNVARLDALLSSLRTPELVPASQPGDEAHALEPLLAAARVLRPLRQATPTVAFTQSLEARLLAEAALLAAAQAGTAPTAERAAPAKIIAEITPTAVVDRASAQWPRRRKPRRRMRILWPAIAAVLLLAMGTLTAAASAGPGSPLYTLHRLEQTARVAMASSPSDRVDLHLRYASDALAAANAAARHGDAAGYRDALATIRSEMSAATGELQSVAAGAEHDRLAASLASLRTRAIANLRTDLPLLSWSQRFTTTDALAALGDVVPRIVAATTSRVLDSGTATGGGSGGSGGSHMWRVQIAGTGFAPGARLLVNGQPAGTVLSATGTWLVATYIAPDGRPPVALGIANPDDTAAQVTAITRTAPMSPGAPGTPGRPDATGTPGGGQSGDHGNSGNGGHGGQGGHDVTPTPPPHGG